MIDIRKPVAAILLAASVGGLLGAAAAQAQTLKVAMGSDVKIVDPIWTTAYIQRDFGYMVWDVLFAMDETLAVRPQMIDKWEVSPDKLLWTFTLRDLAWSNGQPVTSGDCIASIRRWGARDSMGRKMLASVDGFEAVDARTFRMKMKEPYGLVLESLGKPSSSPAFMMPKKTADTDPNTQIKVEDVIGSGPFTFKADEWKPGEKIVFLRNGGYRPRNEPPSGLAGGKVAKVERVEWIWIPDAQTQVAALGNGEIDIIQAPPHDLLPILSQDRNAKLFDSNPLGSQYEFRFNTLFKPFDDPRIRHAAMVAFGQEEFLKATIGDPKYYKVCKAPFVCGTPLGSEEGMKAVLNQDAARARELLKQAGYDGTPVVLMQATDVAAMTNLGPVAKAQLEAAGFKVDMQSNAGDGLADAGCPARQEGSARQGGLERPVHLFGRRRYSQSGVGQPLQRVLRQGHLRLAMRRRDREAARCLCPGDRSREAEADRDGAAEALGRGADLRRSRPALPALCPAHEYRRHAGGAGDGVLEHHEEINVVS